MKGICFKEPLFRATIEGGKTQTRRIMEPQPDGNFNGKNCFGVFQNSNFGNPVAVKPRYKVGEVLYLKEPYNDEASQYRTLYKFDNDVGNAGKGFWKNKLFMSEEAARYFIRITGVRGERLQDISEEDCIKEGIRHDEANPGYTGWYTGTLIRSTPQAAYAALIDQINGRGTWDSNSWVWVYDYELYERS